MSNDSPAISAADAARAAPRSEKAGRQGLIAAGGLIGALAASSCCLLPLALTLAGVSGAWMANLRALAPYQPLFAAGTLAMLGYGFYLVYRKPGQACEQSAACASPGIPNRIVRAILWAASFVVVLALSLPVWLPLITPYLP